MVSCTRRFTHRRYRLSSFGQVCLSASLLNQFKTVRNQSVCSITSLNKVIFRTTSYSPNLFVRTIGPESSHMRNTQHDEQYLMLSETSLSKLDIFMSLNSECLC